MRRLSGTQVGRIPVVDRRDHRKLLGVLRRSDILNAYGRALAHRDNVSERMARLRASTEANIHFVEIEIPHGSSANGRSITEINLPHDSVLVSVKRRGRTLIPHGSTLLQEGDRVTALVAEASEGDLVDALTKHQPNSSLKESSDSSH